VPATAPATVRAPPTRRELVLLVLIAGPPLAATSRSGPLEPGGAREAEVEDADAAVAADEHVARLEVAVDDAGVVGGGEASAGLDEHGDDLAPGAFFMAQPAAQGAALDQLHGDEDLALKLADLVDGDDVGVREAGERLRLAQQAAAARRALSELGAEDLEGDLAVELFVPRGEDQPHASFIEVAKHGEAADFGAGAADEPLLEQIVAAMVVDRGGVDRLGDDGRPVGERALAGRVDEGPGGRRSSSSGRDWG
jgi:hypothetical protein